MPPRVRLEFQVESKAADLPRHFSPDDRTNLEDIRECCKYGEHLLARPEDFVSPEPHGRIGNRTSHGSIRDTEALFLQEGRPDGRKGEHPLATPEDFVSPVHWRRPVQVGLHHLLVRQD